MDAFRRLEEYFTHFPGIGPRQAKRFVYYLINKSPSFIKEFTILIEEVKKATFECSKCHRFFFKKNQPHSNPIICDICDDLHRNQNILMIVARDSDFETIEKSTAYNGLYFILGGSVPLMDKEPEKRIRLKELKEYISNSKSLKEIILSLNTTVDGDHTAKILKYDLQDILATKSIQLTILGRGLSTGAELEYADSETIKNALQNRH